MSSGQDALDVGDNESAGVSKLDLRVPRDTNVLWDLVTELEAGSLWDGLAAGTVGNPTEASLNAVHAFIKRKDTLTVHAQELTRRQLDMRHLVRAAAFKAEASTVPGYLPTLLNDNGFSPAENAKSEKRALNAAVLRLLSANLNNQQADKYRISRCAMAMIGIEQVCKNHHTQLTIGNADAILTLVCKRSRSELCEIGQKSEVPLADDLAPDMEPARAEYSETPDKVDRGGRRDEPATEDSTQPASTFSGPRISESAPSPTHIESLVDLGHFPSLATIAISREELQKGNNFLLIAERTETAFRLRGPIRYFDDALRIAQALLEGKPDSRVDQANKGRSDAPSI